LFARLQEMMQKQRVIIITRAIQQPQLRRQQDQQHQLIRSNMNYKLLLSYTLLFGSMVCSENVEIIHVKRIAHEDIPAFIASLDASFVSEGSGKLTQTKTFSSVRSENVDFDLDTIDVVSDTEEISK